MTFPEKYRWVAKYVAGVEWPEGDETAMRRVAEGWSGMATTLREVREEDTDPAVRDVLETLGGRGENHDAFERMWRGEGGTDKGLQSLAKYCDKMAESLETAAADIEHAKMMVYFALVTFALEFLSMAWTGIGAIAATGPLRMATAMGIRMAIRQVVKKLLMNGAVKAGERALLKRELAKRIGIGAAKGVAFGVAEGLGTDIAAQWLQFAKGDRKEWDGKSLTDSTVGGILGGGVGGGLGTGGLGQAYAHKNLSGAARLAADTAQEAAAGVAGNVASTLASDGEIDLSTITSGASGGAQGVAGGAVRGAKDGLTHIKDAITGDTATPASVESTAPAAVPKPAAAHPIAHTQPDIGAQYPAWSDKPGDMTPAGHVESSPARGNTATHFHNVAQDVTGYTPSSFTENLGAAQPTITHGDTHGLNITPDTYTQYPAQPVTDTHTTAAGDTHGVDTAAQAAAPTPVVEHLGPRTDPRPDDSTVSAPDDLGHGESEHNGAGSRESSRTGRAPVDSTTPINTRTDTAPGQVGVHPTRTATPDSAPLTPHSTSPRPEVGTGPTHARSEPQRHIGAPSEAPTNRPNKVQQPELDLSAFQQKSNQLQDHGSHLGTVDRSSNPNSHRQPTANPPDLPTRRLGEQIRKGEQPELDLSAYQQKPDAGPAPVTHTGSEPIPRQDHQTPAPETHSASSTEAPVHLEGTDGGSRLSKLRDYLMPFHRRQDHLTAKRLAELVWKTLHPRDFGSASHVRTTRHDFDPFCSENELPTHLSGRRPRQSDLDSAVPVDLDSLRTGMPGNDIPIWRHPTSDSEHFLHRSNAVWKLDDQPLQTIFAKGFGVSDPKALNVAESLGGGPDGAGIVLTSSSPEHTVSQDLPNLKKEVGRLIAEGKLLKVGENKYSYNSNLYECHSNNTIDVDATLHYNGRTGVSTNGTLASPGGLSAGSVYRCWTREIVVDGQGNVLGIEIRNPIVNPRFAHFDNHTFQQSHPAQTEISSGGGYKIGHSKEVTDNLDSDHDLIWAEKAYRDIRDADDIAQMQWHLESAPRDVDLQDFDHHEKQAKKTGFSTDELNTVKNRLFHSGNGAVDPDIPDAWVRLRSGRHTPEDLMLLEHHLAKENHLREHPDATAAEAEQAANSKYNWAAEHRRTRPEDYTWNGPQHSDLGASRGTRMEI